MYFVFYQRVGRGVWWTCPLFCPPLFSVSKASGCQTAKPAGSLFECQNGGRGKGSRKPVIKIPTTLLTASPQPAFISLSGLGCKGRWGSAAWLKTRETNLKLDVEGMSWKTALDTEMYLRVKQRWPQICRSLWVRGWRNLLRDARSAFANATIVVYYQDKTKNPKRVGWLCQTFDSKIQDQVRQSWVCYILFFSVSPFTGEERTRQEKS